MMGIPLDGTYMFNQELFITQSFIPHSCFCQASQYFGYHRVRETLLQVIYFIELTVNKTFADVVSREFLTHTML
jgi:hypothetical protein